MIFNHKTFKLQQIDINRSYFFGGCLLARGFSSESNIRKRFRRLESCPSKASNLKSTVGDLESRALVDRGEDFESQRCMDLRWHVGRLGVCCRLGYTCGNDSAITCARSSSFTVAICHGQIFTARKLPGWVALRWSVGCWQHNELHCKVSPEKWQWLVNNSLAFTLNLFHNLPISLSHLRYGSVFCGSGGRRSKKGRGHKWIRIIYRPKQRQRGQS